jgi:hypothetical protein
MSYFQFISGSPFNRVSCDLMFSLHRKVSYMKTTLLSLCAFVLCLVSLPAFAIDQVKLTNGQVVEGTVLNDMTNLYVDIRLVNGDTRRIPHSEVASVDRDVPSRKDRDVLGNQSLGFVSLNLGGFYNLDTPPNNKVLFDYGVKAGAVTGQIGDSKLAFAVSYDRASSDDFGFSSAYNDINLEMLFMRIGNSGFYIGPNVGLAIRTVSEDGVDGASTSFTDFEAGGSVGYEVFLSDGFSIGPDVRYEHIFGDSKLNCLKFTLAGTIHF